ncbi:peptidyl-prolyl cis-trans isomerase FKBP1B isoform X2 [Zonotrichia albicollis]
MCEHGCLPPWLFVTGNADPPLALSRVLLSGRSEARLLVSMCVRRACSITPGTPAPAHAPSPPPLGLRTGTRGAKAGETPAGALRRAPSLQRALPGGWQQHAPHGRACGSDAGGGHLLRKAPLVPAAPGALGAGRADPSPPLPVLPAPAPHWLRALTGSGAALPRGTARTGGPAAPPSGAESRRCRHGGGDRDHLSGRRTDISKEGSDVCGALHR